MNWYVRGDDGAEANSGDTDAAAADLSVADFAVVGTAFSSVTGGFAALVGRAVNIQVGGSSEIRLLSTITDDNNGTISAAPSAGNGTYAAKVGGARAAINSVANSGANNNSVLVAADTVRVRPKAGSYNELVTFNVACGIKSLGGPVTLDGTGLGAGSDPILISASIDLQGFKVTGAVDRGFFRTAATSYLFDCHAISPGAHAFHFQGDASRIVACSGSGGTIGIGPHQSGPNGNIYKCQFSGMSDYGVGDVRDFMDCLVHECATGVKYKNNWKPHWSRNSILYSTGDGVEIKQTTNFSDGGLVEDNLIAFNGGYGINSSAGAQAKRYSARANLYYGNTSGARNNFNADDEGYTVTAADPLFINVATDDYRLQPSSPAVGTGIGPTGLFPNIGATPVINDYPAVGDVTSGVDYAGATLTGTASGGGGLLTHPGMAGGMRG